MGYRYYRVILVKADIIAMVYSQNIRIFWIMPVCQEEPKRTRMAEPHTKHWDLTQDPIPDPTQDPAHYNGTVGT